MSSQLSHYSFESLNVFDIDVNEESRANSLDELEHKTSTFIKFVLSYASLSISENDRAPIAESEESIQRNN